MFVPLCSQENSHLLKVLKQTWTVPAHSDLQNAVGLKEPFAILNERHSQKEMISAELNEVAILVFVQSFFFLSTKFCLIRSKEPQ